MKLERGYGLSKEIDGPSDEDNGVLVAVWQ